MDKSLFSLRIEPEYPEPGDTELLWVVEVEFLLNMNSPLEAQTVYTGNSKREAIETAIQTLKLEII
jgi:hypothetical protein